MSAEIIALIPSISEARKLAIIMIPLAIAYAYACCNSLKLDAVFNHPQGEKRAAAAAPAPAYG